MEAAIHDIILLLNRFNNAYNIPTGIYSYMKRKIVPARVWFTGPFGSRDGRTVTSNYKIRHILCTLTRLAGEKKKPYQSWILQITGSVFTKQDNGTIVVIALTLSTTAYYYYYYYYTYSHHNICLSTFRKCPDFFFLFDYFFFTIINFFSTYERILLLLLPILKTDATKREVTKRNSHHDYVVMDHLKRVYIYYRV